MAHEGQARVDRSRLKGVTLWSLAMVIVGFCEVLLQRNQRARGNNAMGSRIGGFGGLGYKLFGALRYVRIRGRLYSSQFKSFVKV